MESGKQQRKRRVRKGKVLYPCAQKYNEGFSAHYDENGKIIAFEVVEGQTGVTYLDAVDAVIKAANDAHKYGDPVKRVDLSFSLYGNAIYLRKILHKDIELVVERLGGTGGYENAQQCWIRRKDGIRVYQDEEYAAFTY